MMKSHFSMNDTMVKKLLYLILLTLLTPSVWAQYNPDNPGDPGIYYHLTLTASPSAGGNVSPSGTIQAEAGDTIICRANPVSGYQFRYWMAEDGTQLSTVDTLEYVMPAHDVQITAVFEWQPNNPDDPDARGYSHKINLTATPASAGRFKQNPLMVVEGDTAYVSAYANVGYTFKSWLLNGETLSTQNPLEVVMGTEDINLTATFSYTPDSPGDPLPEEITDSVPVPVIERNGNMIGMHVSFDGAVIHYTMDGSTPDSTSTVYKDSITVSSNCVIKAIALHPLLHASKVVTFEVNWFPDPSANPEPYAVLSDNNTVLTFYYDGHKEEREGMIIGNSGTPKWISNAGSVTKVVFDPSFDSYRPTTTQYWFTDMSLLTTIEGIQYLHTDNVTVMSYMFYGCSSLTSLDLSGFNTQNLTNMVYMFYACSGLTGLDLSGFNTQKVTSMDSMFEGCSGLTSLDVSNFNTVNAYAMASLFKDCSSLKTLDLSSFYLNSPRIAHMFDGCSSLTTIYTKSSWYSMYAGTTAENNSLFTGCVSLVGGKGTTYDANHVNYEYARIDGGPDNPGYFTDIADKDKVVWSVIGTINGNWDTDTEMTTTDGMNYTATIPYVAAGSYEFKIRANGSWDVNYGLNGEPGGQNIPVTVDEDNTGVAITFNVDTKEISFSLVPPVYTVAGDFTGWVDSQPMVKDDKGVYSITFDNIAAGNYEYKIKTNGSWDVNYGLDGVFGGINIPLTVSEAGPVTIYFNPVTKIAGTEYPQATERVATPTFSWNEDMLTISSETEGATINYTLADGYYLVGGNGEWNSDRVQKFSHSDLPVSEDPIYSYILTGGQELWFAFGDARALYAISNYEWNLLYGTTGQSEDMSGSFDRRYNMGQDNSFHVDGSAPYYRFTINVQNHTYEITPLDSNPGPNLNADSTYTYNAPVKIQRDLFVFATANKPGMIDSQEAVLDYPYTAWQDLLAAIEKAMEAIRQATGNESIQTQTLEQLKYQIDIAQTMYSERKADENTIKNQTAKIRELTDNILNSVNTNGFSTCADVIAGEDGKTYRVKGRVQKIVNTTYGNWYLEDDTDSLYIYGTVDYAGKFPRNGMSWESHGVNVGDIVAVQGPKQTYNGTTELVNVRVLTPMTLLNVSSNDEAMSVMSSQQGIILSPNASTVTASLYYEGDDCEVVIPEESQSWLTIQSMVKDNGDAEYKFDIMNNPTTAGRGDMIIFRTTKNGVDYETNLYIGQEAPELEPYAVLTGDTISGMTLTFYYDKQKADRNGMGVGPFEVTYYDDYELVNSGWDPYRDHITSVVFDDSFADCETIYSTAAWFYGFSKLTTITNIRNLKTDNVYSMGDMFWDCESLETIDVSGFNTSNVWDFGGMFGYCFSLKTLDVSHLDTSSSTWMRRMFSGCYNLTSLDVSKFKTDNVTNMLGMFEYCYGLTSLDVSEFKTDSVTDISLMFYGCSGLTRLDVSGFNTEKVTTMWGMFSGCSSLTSLDVSHFDTKNVTTTTRMFDGCSKLATLDVSQFNTDGVTAFGAMFRGCSALRSIDVSRFNTSNAQYIWSMFEGCSNLTSLDLSGFATDSVLQMSKIFVDCNNLKTIYAKEAWNTAKVELSNDMFTNCNSIVGGAGTIYNAEHTDHVYARIDGGPNSETPGYFTRSGDEPYQPSSDGWVEQLANGDAEKPWVNPDTRWDDAANNYKICAWGKTKGRNMTEDGEGWNAFPADIEEEEGGNGNHVFVVHAAKADTEGDASAWDNQFWIQSPHAWSAGTQIRIKFRYKASKDVVANTQVHKQSPSEYLHWLAIGDISFTTDWKEYDGIMTVTDEMDGCWSIAFNLNTNEKSATDFYFDDLSWSVNRSGKPEPYSVLTDNTDVVTSAETGKTLSGKTLTFYYDDQKAIRGGKDVKPFQLAWYDDVWTVNSGWHDQCEALTSVVFDESFANCTTLTSTNYWFYSCKNLATIQGIEHLNTENVTSMDAMFYGCSSLTNLDVSGFKTDNVTDMYGMFYNCSRLTSLDLSGFNMSKIEYSNLMFASCSALKTIYGSDWNMPAIIDGGYMFTGCISLVGGKGTTYDANRVDHTYAHIDGGSSNPGYFTEKDAPVIDYAFDSNGVLTVRGTTALADALSAAGGRDEVAKTITAIIWNSAAKLTNNDLQGMDNPNMLIYVADASLAPANRDNVIIGNDSTGYMAMNIVLSDVESGNNNFYCPQEFTAEMISYTRNFQQETQVGVSRGWETLALPFAVQTIMHEKNGVIAPFGNDASGKHFWLRRLGDNGLTQATGIEANVPYLISMPNSAEYPAEFNQAGRVTFSSQNAVVPVTSGNIASTRDSVSNTMIVLYPAMQRVAQNEEIYALNVGNAQNGYAEGSVFVAGLRDVRPFECYTWHHGHSPAPRYIAVNELNGGATGILTSHLSPLTSIEGVWYDLNGRKLQQKPTRKGVYILNGSKVVVK